MEGDIKAGDEEKIREVLQEVSRRITPTPREKKELVEFVDRLIGQIKRICRDMNLDVTPMLVGSTARDTWLRGERDIDVFLLFPTDYTRDQLKGLIIKVAEQITPNFVVKYAEHPYARLEMLGFQVDLVPCYRVESPDQRISAVDRTPFHNVYVISKMDKRKAEEVRLLKQFMKGLGVYGADVRTSGFSGYLCELLIIHYDTFTDLLRQASKWRRGTLIDIEGHYRSTNEVKTLFRDPLVVIDPVDRGRNVAAAVSESSMSKFILGSIRFLQSPSLDLFFPAEHKVTLEDAINQIRKRGTYWVFVEFYLEEETSPDIVWPQLRKLLEKVKRQLEERGVRVLDAAEWTDEEKLCVLAFEVENRLLSRVKIHKGPGVLQGDLKNVLRFIKKYKENVNVLRGPYLRGQRLFVDLKRQECDVKAILGGVLLRSVQGSNIVERALLKRHRVLDHEELGKLRKDAIEWIGSLLKKGLFGA